MGQIVRGYCIVLLIEGKDVNENKRVHKEVAEATQKIAGIMNQLPKHIDEPPYIIVIHQESFSIERILLWSLNVNYNEVKEPCVAVLYGRGRMIGPLLEGKQITGSGVFSILSIIGLSCECGLDKSYMMGTLLPLRWGEKTQSDVVKFLGFDAESPMVKMEMSSIMSISRSTIREDKGNIESSADALDEYKEDVLPYESGSSVARVSPAQLNELALMESATFKSSLNLKTMLPILGIIVLLILIGGLFILLRASRRT